LNMITPPSYKTVPIHNMVIVIKNVSSSISH
jgi:hypothetical protein